MPFRNVNMEQDRRLVVLEDHAVPRISVVIPARNEAANLPHVLARLPERVFEVILVDGGSTDGTVQAALLCRPDVRVVRQNRRGKGNALACGFAAVRGDTVVMLDADGSADPEEIPRYVEALLAGADFAKGSRFAAGGGSSDLTRLRSVGNQWLNLVVNVLYRTDYTDLCYGYNAFWTRCLPTLGLQPGDMALDRMLWGDGFEVETIINTRIARGRLNVVEVPSFVLARLHGESKLNTWRDGFRVLRAVVSERFRRTPVTPRPARSVSPIVEDEVDIQAAAGA